AYHFSSAFGFDAGRARLNEETLLPTAEAPFTPAENTVANAVPTARQPRSADLSTSHAPHAIEAAAATSISGQKLTRAAPAGNNTFRQRPGDAARKRRKIPGRGGKAEPGRDQDPAAQERGDAPEPPSRRRAADEAPAPRRQRQRQCKGGPADHLEQQVGAIRA